MIKGVLENVTALRRGEEVLSRISDGHYTQIVRPLFDSAPGAHFRHNLDHYRCFLEGVAVGLIDYSARPRNPLLEHCRQSALQESRLLREAFEKLQAPCTHLWLLADGDQGRTRMITSIERELEFLHSHTIHHYAIVALICRVQGVTIPAEFGVAPSTLRYRAALAGNQPEKSLAACAP